MDFELLCLKARRKKARAHLCQKSLYLVKQLLTYPPKVQPIFLHQSLASHCKNRKPTESIVYAMLSALPSVHGVLVFFYLRSKHWFIVKASSTKAFLNHKLIIFSLWRAKLFYNSEKPLEF
jgi:hypothetical protein